MDDNTVDGPSIPPSGFIPSDAGARLQFTRINAILRRAIDRMADGTDTLARVKAQISALRDQDEGQLPAAQNSMRGVKAAALRSSPDSNRIARRPTTRRMLRGGCKT